MKTKHDGQAAHKAPRCRKCGRLKIGDNVIHKRVKGRPTTACRACHREAQRRFRLRKRGVNIPRRRMSLDERIAWYVQQFGWDACWIGPYGKKLWPKTTVQGRTRNLARAIYERFHGVCLLGSALLDHHDYLHGGCADSRCTNPFHVVPTDARGNALTGNSPAGINSRKTHCIREHPFTPSNTFVDAGGRRTCLRCAELEHRDSTDPAQLSLGLSDPRRPLRCVA